MFRHIVLLQWKDEATAEQRAGVVTALRRLPAVIPELKGYVLGDDAGVNDGNFSLGIVADFDDVEGYLVYRDDPTHNQIIREKIAPILAGRAAVQHEVTG
jgi:hypothetical protein